MSDFVSPPSARPKLFVPVLLAVCRSRLVEARSYSCLSQEQPQTTRARAARERQPAKSSSALSFEVCALCQGWRYQPHRTVLPSLSADHGWKPSTPIACPVLTVPACAARSDAIQIVGVGYVEGRRRVTQIWPTWPIPSHFGWPAEDQRAISPSRLRPKLFVLVWLAACRSFFVRARSYSCPSQER